MEAGEHGNWIRGEPVAARERGRFDLVPRGGPRLGSWPRSGAGDVSDVVRSLRGGAAAWRARPEPERREQLRGAAAALAEAPDPGGGLQAVLGLSPGEVEQCFESLGPTLEGALGAPAPAEAGPVLVHHHWSELHAGGTLALLRALAGGASACWIADPRTPFLADAVAVALVAAGVPGDVFAVLHDDGRTCLGAALATGAFARIDASGFEHQAESFHAPAEKARRTTHPAPFGSGVVTDAPVVTWHALTCSVLRLDDGADPERAAARVLHEAFGRVPALGGQAPGQLGRVRCAPRLFSRFTAALLERLDDPGPELAPLPLLDADLPRVLEDLRDLGLDEGATLIRELPEGSHSHGGRGILDRLVFTNVEPAMRLAACSRPAPLLCLGRDAAGKAPSDHRPAAEPAAGRASRCPADHEESSP